jgi:hypothetical protein
MPAPPRPAFIARNWKWMLPLGCLGMLVMLGGLTFGFMAVVFTAIKSSDVYQAAIQAARAHPEVRRELGDPIETGFWASGSVQVAGPSGHADISVPLTGSKQSGTLYGVADKSAGRWTFSLLEVEVDGRPNRIDLRAVAP